MEEKKISAIAEERALLESLYTDVEGPDHNAHSQRMWTFTHSCGTRQTWTMSNIRKQTKNSRVPCKTCGAKERIAKAMKAFIDAHGRNYDYDVWCDFVQKVRYLSDKTYIKHRAEIDPLGVGRSVHGYHLDHKLSIIEGFKRGMMPEELAVKENLQMLPAKENLSKGKQCQ